MSDKKLIFYWVTIPSLVLITIFILGTYFELPNSNKYLFIPFIVLLSLIIGFYLYDKTKQKNFSKREFSKLLLESVELEKKVISNEMHDGLQQQLNFILFDLKKINTTNFTPKEKIEKLIDKINNTISDVRRISSQLYPHQLENLGMEKAVIGMINNLSDNSAVFFKIKIEDNVDAIFGDKASINLFRIIQELCTNIIKHSEATQATVKMSTDNIHFYLMIEDNGKGFEKIQRKVDALKKGIGLTSIYERLKVMNGNMTIKTDDSGSIFKIIIPVNNIFN